MFRNYLKVALRSFTKQKGYFLLNITGLAVGLATAILIFLYISQEVTFNRSYPDHERTFAIGTQYTDQQGNKSKFSFTPSGLPHLLQERSPEVQEVTRIKFLGYPHILNDPDNPDRMVTTQDGEVFYVEDGYPEFFHFEPLLRNKNQLFSEPNRVVLTETMAQDIFGENNVLGRQLELKNLLLTADQPPIVVQVAGIIRDHPENVHLRPKLLISMSTLNSRYQRNRNQSVQDAMNSLEGDYSGCYIKVSETADLSDLQAGIDQIMNDVNQARAEKSEPYLRNVADLHFDEEVDWSFWDRQADFSYIIIFGSVGLMILLIACINYMNLATAKSARRAREVGVRKSLGSTRLPLMLQFFQESLLTTFLSLIVAFLFVLLLLPFFNDLAGTNFNISALLQPGVLLGSLIIWLLIAFIAGIYPAVFLSGFKPTDVLKGKLVLGKGPVYFRKSLVVVQFTVSMFLLISTGIVLQQMSLLHTTKLYRNADYVMSINIGGITTVERCQTLKNELLQDPEIEDVTLAVMLPRPKLSNPLLASLSMPELSDQVYSWKRLGGDYDFPQVFDLELLAGRSFDERNPSDSNNYIINETALRTINKTPEEIIGYTLLDTATNESGQIIGVVKDFHFETILNTIKPTVIQGKPQGSRQLFVKLPAENLNNKIALVEEKWKAVMPPGVPLIYKFMSDNFETLYRPEYNMSRMIRSFSLLAVIIACLGLYGLASYTAEQKTKEIGIRKSLGASVGQITFMLMSDFLKMVLIACLIALPIGYLIMQDWLQNFVYRVEISWLIFAVSAGIILLLTVFTVAYETIKASRLDPAKTLRYE